MKKKRDEKNILQSLQAEKLTAKKVINKGKPFIYVFNEYGRIIKREKGKTLSVLKKYTFHKAISLTDKNIQYTGRLKGKKIPVHTISADENLISKSLKPKYLTQVYQFTDGKRKIKVIARARAGKISNKKDFERAQSSAYNNAFRKAQAILNVKSKKIRLLSKKKGSITEIKGLSIPTRI